MAATTPGPKLGAISPVFRRAAIIHDQNTTDSMPQNSPPDATRPRRCTSRGSMRLRVHFDMRRTLPIPSPALHDDASPPLSLPGSAHRLDRFLAPAGTTTSRALISSRREMESQLHVELFACNVNQDHVVRAHTILPYHTFVRKLGDRSIRHHRRPTTHRASEATWERQPFSFVRAHPPPCPWDRKVFSLPVGVTRGSRSPCVEARMHTWRQLIEIEGSPI